METATASRLRKRKAVEYTEDDDIDGNVLSPKKKAKTVAKPTKTKAGTSSKSVKSAETIKKVPKSKETKVSKTKEAKVPKSKETKVSKSKVDNLETPSENDENIGLFDNHENIPNVWNEAEMLAQVERIPLQLAQNLIGLLTEGCTLPFIARYRKTAVDNLMPDR